MGLRDGGNLTQRIRPLAVQPDSSILAAVLDSLKFNVVCLLVGLLPMQVVAAAIPQCVHGESPRAITLDGLQTSNVSRIGHTHDASHAGRHAAPSSSDQHHHAPAPGTDHAAGHGANAFETCAPCGAGACLTDSGAVPEAEAPATGGVLCYSVHVRTDPVPDRLERPPRLRAA